MRISSFGNTPFLNTYFTESDPFLIITMKGVVLCMAVLATCGVFFQFTDGCSLLFPDVCKNVTCPNGVPCQSDASYWSEHRIGGVSLPPLARCENAEPCTGHVCRAGTRCVKVKDSCNAEGICTVKAQCNEITRPGRCPAPETVHVHSCMNSCKDDAFCEGNSKCCRSKSTGGTWCARTGSQTVSEH